MSIENNQQQDLNQNPTTSLSPGSVNSGTPVSPTPAPQTQIKPATKERIFTKPRLIIVFFVILLVASTGSAFAFGKHGQSVIIKPPDALPITLPPQAVVVSDCVAGFGKRYILPKDIPNGPIYDVKDSKVIAVEYNYKAIDLYANPDRLSDTMVPFMKNYKIDHFVTTLGELKAGDLKDAQNVPIHLIMYVVPKTEAEQITCPKTS